MELQFCTLTLYMCITDVFSRLCLSCSPTSALKWNGIIDPSVFGNVTWSFYVWKWNFLYTYAYYWNYVYLYLGDGFSKWFGSRISVHLHSKEWNLGGIKPDSFIPWNGI